MHELARRAYKIKRYMKKDRLAIKKTFDCQTSFYKKSDESKPYFTISTSGTVKFDILQLAIFVSFVILLFSSVALFIKLCKLIKNARD